MQVAKARLDAAENFKERRETLSTLAAATETELVEAGLILAKSRRKAAVALRRDVTTALSSIAMEGCRFDVSLSWENISSGVAMISSRDATVTGSQDASDPAGKRSEMAHQLAIMAKALKRDMEEALCKNGDKTTGNATTARVTGGFESWIETNESRGATGASTGGGAAPTDGTQRDLTEDLLKDVLQQMFASGAEPNMAICGPHNKQVISGFTGRTQARQFVDANTVEASVSIYSSDFGELKIVPSNRSRERTLLLVDPEFAKVSYLRDFQTVDIATIGDAETKMIVCEYGLEVSNEAAHGVVADLNVS